MSDSAKPIFWTTFILSPLVLCKDLSIHIIVKCLWAHGQHDRDKRIIPGSHWEKPAWWSNVLSWGGLSIYGALRRKTWKADFLITLNPLQPLALLYTCASFIGNLSLLYLREGDPLLDLLHSNPQKVLRPRWGRNRRSGRASIPHFWASARIHDIEIYSMEYTAVVVSIPSPRHFGMVSEPYNFARRKDAYYRR